MEKRSDRKKGVWNGFGTGEIEGHSAKSQIDNAGAVRRLVAQNGVRVGAGHGEAFRSEEGSLEWFRNWRNRGPLRQIPDRQRGRGEKVGRPKRRTRWCRPWRSVQIGRASCRER